MIYQKEMLEAAETAKALVEGLKNTSSDFTTATHVEHVKAMFKVHVLLHIVVRPLFVTTLPFKRYFITTVWKVFFDAYCIYCTCIE